MTDRLTILHICDILQDQMSLTDDQIWIYNEKQDIPTDPGLHISVGQMGITPIGNNRKFLGTTEKISQTYQETIAIEVFSKDTSALSALPQVLGALASTYSIQIQERYGFKISTVPTTVNDTSFLENTAIVYRLSITIRVIRAYEVTKDVEYYEHFENTITSES